MDRRKTFFILATLGALMVTLPFLYKGMTGQSEPIVPGTVEYFPVQDPGTELWGFVDREGNPVTAMVFDWAGDFRQGLGLRKIRQIF